MIVGGLMQAPHDKLYKVGKGLALSMQDLGRNLVSRFRSPQHQLQF